MNREAQRIRATGEQPREFEWPLGAPAEPIRGMGEHGARNVDAFHTEPLLPLALEAQVELVKAGAAIDAFARKRAVQIVTHGHTPEADLEKPIGLLACEAKARLDALTEIVGGRYGRMNLPAEHRERCVRYIDIAGGILLALRERVEVEVPEE